MRLWPGKELPPRTDEPRILTEDVQRIVRRVIHPDDPDFGEAVQQFAEPATTSTRTVYRVLNGSAGASTQPPSILLSLADRLVTAAGEHLATTRALTPAGSVVEYLEAP